MQFTLNIIAALLAVSTSTVTAAQKSSNLRGGGHKLHEETVLSDPSPAGLSTIVEDTTVDPAVPEYGRSLRNGCPGLDYPENGKRDGRVCKNGRILCWDVWEQKSYCHDVGMDTAVDEATPAPLDQVSPTRKLQEDGETSTNSFCPLLDTHFLPDDDKCPAGQIMCHNVNCYDSNLIEYCYVAGSSPGHGDMMCPESDYQANQCQPGHCDTDETSCWSKFSQNCYCHYVGVDLDTTADEATPAPLDQVSPTRKLQEEGETSTIPSDGCPGLDTHFPHHDGDCPIHQIACQRTLDSIFSPKKYYCHHL